MVENSLAVFENDKIRRHFDEETASWYFSVIDVVEALIISKNPTDYLKKLRKRDSELKIDFIREAPQCCPWLQSLFPVVKGDYETKPLSTHFTGHCPRFFHLVGH